MRKYDIDYPTQTYAQYFSERVGAPRQLMTESFAIPRRQGPSGWGALPEYHSLVENFRDDL